MSNDVSQSKGYDRDESDRLMQVDGQVIIFRFALQQFSISFYWTNNVLSKLYDIEPL